MQKQHAWPDGHWNWPISISHKHGVRCGDMMWMGGQVDLSPEGKVLNPGNLEIQTANVIVNLDRVLNELGGSNQDLVNLNCFYVNDGSVDERKFLNLVAAALPAGTRTTVTAIPVPYLAYPDMLVEIEGVAMRSSEGDAIPRSYAGETCPGLLSEKFCTAVRCGQMIFVSAQSPVDSSGQTLAHGDIVMQTRLVASHLENALGTFDASFDDVVKTNRWYSGGDGIENFEPAALAFAANFTEPGPAATGIPLPRHADPDMLIRIGVIAMLGEDGEHLPRRHVWPASLWDWHVHLPYKHGVKCGQMIFLGGQVSLNKKGEAIHPGELTPQTHQAMAHIRTILNELGADFDDVCKVMAVYAGDCGAEALNENLPVRSSYFNEPGPATTGVPLPVLAYEGMSIEIDIYAMTEAD
jgi:enamine deaminase RidA (YjgF/YER057c/UK114 family)